MTVAIADTTVVIHLFRRYAPALTWYSELAQPLGITPVTWLLNLIGGDRSGFGKMSSAFSIPNNMTTGFKVSRIM